MSIQEMDEMRDLAVILTRVRRKSKSMKEEHQKAMKTISSDDCKRKECQVFQRRWELHDRTNNFYKHIMHIQWLRQSRVRYRVLFGITWRMCSKVHSKLCTWWWPLLFWKKPLMTQACLQGLMTMPLLLQQLLHHNYYLFRYSLKSC